MSIGEIIVRRPFPIRELPRLYQWCVSFRHQTMDDFSPQTEDEFVNYYLEGIERGMKTWGVFRQAEGVEELGGFVSVTNTNPVNASTHVLFKREFFGRRTTVPALLKTFTEVFEDGETEKLNMTVFADNHQISALVQSINFKREGRIRHHTKRRGQPIDTIIFGITREEFQSCHLQPPSHSSVPELEPLVDSSATNPEPQTAATLTSAS